MNQNLIAQLSNYGLSEKESKVYIIILELEQASVSAIARASWEKRPTVYFITESLQKKWYIESISLKNIINYIAKEPYEVLKRERAKLTQLESIIPQLEELGNKKWIKPKLRFLEWNLWLSELFEDFTESTVDTKLIFGTHKKFDDKHLPLAEKVRKYRKKHNLISKRIIINQDDSASLSKDDDLKYNRETKYLNNFPQNIEVDINIYWPNKVSIHFFDDLEKPYTIIIEHNSLYKTMEAIFDYMWEQK